MTTAIKRRRGTTTQHSTFTGLEGEITVDSTKDTVVVHDGSTAGGFALLREDLSNNTNVITATNTKTLTNKTVDLASNTLTGTTAQFNAALSDNDFATLAGTETLSNKTFSTNPTISSGTANGVAYLNGSKVLTTGSALTYNGTGLGIGGTALAPLDVFTSQGRFLFRNGENTGGTNDGVGITAVTTDASAVANMNYRALNHAFIISGSEQMRLTSTGLGIGTTSSPLKLSILSNNATNNNSVPLILLGSDRTDYYSSINCVRGSASSYLGLAFSVSNNTAPAEAMRIDSSGNLLVGTTNSSSTAGSGTKVIDSGQTIATVSGYTTNSYSSLIMYSTGASAYRFYVDYSGTVHATSATISAISDQRFKENVRDLDAGLAEVMALKPRLYDWKEGKGANIKNARGFIAQEFEQVFPDLIDEWKDPAPEGEEPYKSVRQDLIPVLVRAIQEQQALIIDLQDRLTKAGL